MAADILERARPPSMTSERLKVSLRALQPPHLTILAGRGTTRYGA